MTIAEPHAEFLFSYGTLQLESVQMATFGRQLTGISDALQGFELVLSRPSYRVRAFRKCFGMVTLGTDGSRQRTTKILRGPQVLDDAAEVVPRLPSQSSSCQVVDVNAIDGRHHRPSTPPILRLVARSVALHDGGGIRAQLAQVLAGEWRGCADNESAKTDRGCLLHGQQVGTDDIFNVSAPIEKFVDLHVGVLVSLPRGLVVVLLGKKT